MPQISIITVSYNAVKVIRKTIESVLSQTGVDVEYIIIDGASSDGTREIIQEYTERLWYWVSEKDGGIYDAMNKGISKARGNLIGILNADDEYLPGALELVWKVFVLNPGVVIHGDIEVSSGNDTVDIWRGIPPNGLSSQFRKMTVSHPATFVPRAIYEKFGAYSREYQLSSDYEFILRLISKKVLFVHLDRLITRFSLGGRSGGVKTYQETLKIQRAYGRGYWTSHAWYWKALLKMHVVKYVPLQVLHWLRWH